MAQSVVATVGVVIFKNDDQDSVCFVEHLAGANHMTGTYGLPAGKIEAKESSLDAAVREMEEETGLLASSKDLIFLKQYHADIQQKDGLKKFSWDVYVCQNYEGNLKESEETKPQWVSTKDFTKIDHFLPNVESAVEEARRIVRINK